MSGVLSSAPVRFMAAPLTALLVRSVVDLEDAFNIFVIRVLYACSQGFLVLLLLYIAASVVRANETDIVRVTEAPGPLEQNAPKKVEKKTIKDYELSLLKKDLMQVRERPQRGRGATHPPASSLRTRTPLNILPPHIFFLSGWLMRARGGRCVLDFGLGRRRWRCRMPWRW
eukprot:COSAG01_NODE_6133_length_3833_cov_1.660150_3_plen_171_part_00